MSDINYKEIKQELNNLRKDLFNYISSQDSEQDLLDKFIKVKERDAATYELILLIYQELKTTHKINKKTLIAIIDKTIELKIQTIENLIEDRLVEDLETEDKLVEPTPPPEPTTIMGKIISAITLKNIFMAVLLWLFSFVVLFTMYNINASAFEKTNKNMWDNVEKTKEILK